MQTKTFNVSFPKDLVQKVDRQAKEEYRSRSEFLKTAALLYLQTKDNWQVLQADIAEKAKKLGVKDESDVENLVDAVRN